MNRQKPRGMALVLVLSVIALASVIGFAMISASAIQARVTHNATDATHADYLGESAVQAALYYLQYPTSIPQDWTTTPGYYLYATNQTIGLIDGSFDLTVQETARNEFEIRVSARARDATSPRSIFCKATVDRAKITGSAHFGGNITIPVRTKVSGTVVIDGTLTNLSGEPIDSVLAAPLPRSMYQTPSASAINYYGAGTADGKYIAPDGTIGYAQKLDSAPTASPVAATNNPGKIFYYENTSLPDLIFTSPVVINGTLVVKGGSLSVRTSELLITPEQGYPALVVEKDLNMYRDGAVLEVNGATWVGRNITWTATPLVNTNTASTLTINGALLMPASSIIQSPKTGGLTVVASIASELDIPNLATNPQPGRTVTLLGWNE